MHAGLYIATCSFDKAIRIFDFFSGALVAQVAAHGETVTGVRFSPDGRFLLSIGGDGCIFVWKIGSALVSAMRDRLVELYHNAQRKSQILREGQNEPLPIPPLVQDSIATPQKTPALRDNALATPSLDPSELSRARETPVSAMQTEAASTGNDESVFLEESAEPKSAGDNPWVAKASSGYELFGQKLSTSHAQSKKDRNKKFTAQFNTEAIGGTRALADDGEVIQPSEAAETAAETADRVMQGDSDDEAMFVGMEEPRAEEYFDFPEADKDLDNASSKLDHLEESMGNLENWLEGKVVSSAL